MYVDDYDMLVDICLVIGIATLFFCIIASKNGE